MVRDDAVLVSLPGERFTPFTAAKKLGAVAILESASFKRGRERYSIIQLDEAFRIRQLPSGVFIEENGISQPWGIVQADGVKEAQRGHPQDILDVLAAIAQENAQAAPHLPVPGAGIGYLGYDFVTYCDKVDLAKKPDPIGIPLAEFIV
ncbi:MAG: anthranilate synthase component I, partial [Termitinemataceae bacterium]